MYNILINVIIIMCNSQGRVYRGAGRAIAPLTYENLFENYKKYISVSCLHK